MHLKKVINKNSKFFTMPKFGKMQFFVNNSFWYILSQSFDSIFQNLPKPTDFWNPLSDILKNFLQFFWLNVFAQNSPLDQTTQNNDKRLLYLRLRFPNEIRFPLADPGSKITLPYCKVIQIRILDPGLFYAILIFRFTYNV